MGGTMPGGMSGDPSGMGGQYMGSAGNRYSDGMPGSGMGGGTNPQQSGGPGMGAMAANGTNSGAASGTAGTGSAGSPQAGGASGQPGGGSAGGSMSRGGLSLPGLAGGGGGAAGMPGAGSPGSCPSGSCGTSVSAVADTAQTQNNPNALESRVASTVQGQAGASGGEALRPGQWEDRMSPSGTGQGASSATSSGGSHQQAAQAVKRRKVWTTDRVPMGAVPFVRAIRVNCSAERLIVSPEPGIDSGRVVYFMTDPGKAADDLIDIVVERMELWGMAGEGMYWRPVLEVSIEPGGRQRFEQLDYLLDGSGLRVESSEVTQRNRTIR